MFTVFEKIRTKITIKSSQFITDLYPTEKVEDFQEQYHAIQKEFYDANHHCYAVRIGVNPLFQKYSDDGEPHGSAGKPMDMTLEKYSLTNCSVVVTRFFGGTKLGVGGLVRAYSDAVEDAIQSAKLMKIIHCTPVTIVCDYKDLSAVIHRFESIAEEFSYSMLEQCTLQFFFATERMENIHRQIEDIRYSCDSIQVFEPIYKTIHAQ